VLHVAKQMVTPAAKIIDSFWYSAYEKVIKLHVFTS
jgi:hypothetical protein